MRVNAGGLSELIVGRQNEVATLKAYIQMGQHCAVIGPRRYGKTTLVNAVLSEIKKEHLVVKIDVFNASSVRELCMLYIDAVYESHGVSNFIKHTKDALLDMASRFSLEVQDIKLGYDALKEDDENTLIQRTFELAEIFSNRLHKKAVVFFDEFGDMERFGVDIIKKMRSIFQTHKNTVYIFAGSQASTMNTIFLDKSNAFFNFASIMKINKLEEKEIAVFLTGLQIQATSFSNDACALIQNTVNGHPFYLIKLIQESYIASLLRGSLSVEPEDVKNAINKILFDNEAFFESEWSKINAKKHKGLILKEIVGIDVEQNKELSLSYKSQLIKELKEQTIIDENKTFIDVFFELWMKKEFIKKD